MKAVSIIFTGEEQVELVEQPMPSPGPGQLLVETVCSMISTGTEMTVYLRNFASGTHWDQWVEYPFHPGYLQAGRVVGVGPGVDGWHIGDRIASRSNHASHVLVDADSTIEDVSPESGDCTPRNRAVRIPEGVSDEEAIWMGLGKITQVGVRAAEHQAGDNVVVIGLGLLGQLVVQYARLLGADEVIAIDTSEARLKMAAAHGSTQTLAMTADKALPRVRELTQGRGADVVYDVTGHPAVFAAALPLARRFGRLVLLGDAGSPQLQTLTPDVITRGVRIVGAHDGHPPQSPTPYVRWSAHEMSKLVLKYIQRGQMRVDDLITHRFNPSHAAKAYTLLKTERDAAMGVVFRWDTSDSFVGD